MTRNLAVTLLCLGMAATGCKGGGDGATPSSSTGSVRVATTSSALSATIARVELTVTAGAGPTFTPIVQDLVKSADGWSGLISGIPVGPGRKFDVAALDASGVTVASGSGTADVTATQPASVVITLASGSGGGTFGGSAPVIGYISASATLVKPGETVRLGASATDPDPTATLTYLWRATCGSITSPTSSTATWTAPATTGSCQVSITVTNNRGSSVTGYVVIDIGPGTGDVQVTVNFGGSTAPVITAVVARVDYHPAEEGDLGVSAASPSGSALTYAWASDCKNLAINTASPYSAASPHFTNPDYSLACTVTVTVTSANGGHVTGVINVAPAPIFRSGPMITVTTQPSVDLADGVEIVNPGDAVLLQAQATGSAGSTLRFTWAATAGTVDGQEASSQAPWRSAAVYHVPSPLAATMRVTVTVTDTGTGETASHVFAFKGPAVVTNPCAGAADGTACDDGNRCTTGDSCRGGSCMGTAITCAASGTCHVAGTCNPATGTCSDPPAVDGTACNDGNLCTAPDVCAAGICIGPLKCATGQTCDPAAGTCVGNAMPAVLSGTLTPGATSVAVGQSFTATLAVRNTGGTAANGVSPAPIPACTGTPGAAPVAAGATVSFSFTGCSGSTTGTLTLSTSATGTDATTSSSVTTGAVTASVTIGAIVPPALATFAPQVARDLPISAPAALAIDTAGNSFVGSALYPSATPISFDGHLVQSGGDADIFLARYGTNGVAQWAVNYGDGAAANPQMATGVAVAADGTVAVLGNFSGSFAIGPGTLSSPSQIDFLVGVKGADGTGLFAKQFNNGGNGALRAVAANPGDGTAHGNRIAVCGYAAGGTPTDFVGTGATAAAGNDIIVGVFTTAGTRLWARQVTSPGTADEDCLAAAVDDVGDVWATGTMSGASLSFGGATSSLPGPNNANRTYVWVAKFNGATGAAMAAAAFSGTGGNVGPTSLAVDGSGNVILGGQFSGNVAFGATSLASARLTDAFVAKISPGLAPLWAVRLGGPGNDTVNGVAVTSNGEVLATGSFLGTTTGAATLVAAGTTAPDLFLLQLSGASGATDFAAGYGDSLPQTGDGIAVNRFGTAWFAATGSLNGSVAFPAPAGTVTAAAGARDLLLLVGQVK